MTASFLLSSTSSFLPSPLPPCPERGKLQVRQISGPGSRLVGALYPVIYPGQPHPCFASSVKAYLSVSDAWERCVLVLGPVTHGRVVYVMLIIVIRCNCKVVKTESMCTVYLFLFVSGLLEEIDNVDKIVLNI